MSEQKKPFVLYGEREIEITGHSHGTCPVELILPSPNNDPTEEEDGE